MLFSCKYKLSKDRYKSTKRHEAQNASSRQLPDINETAMGHTPQTTVHNTINHFTCQQAECQGNLFKSLCMNGLFLFTLTKTVKIPPLTKDWSRDKMSAHSVGWQNSCPQNVQTGVTCLCGSSNARQYAPPRVSPRVKIRGGVDQAICPTSGTSPCKI